MPDGRGWVGSSGRLPPSPVSRGPGLHCPCLEDSGHPQAPLPKPTLPCPLRYPNRCLQRAVLVIFCPCSSQGLGPSRAEAVASTAQLPAVPGRPCPTPGGWRHRVVVSFLFLRTLPEVLTLPRTQPEAPSQAPIPGRGSRPRAWCPSWLWTPRVCPDVAQGGLTHPHITEWL